MRRIADPATWQDRVFAMVSPDCLARHLTSEVMNRFAGIGLRPAAWRLTPVTPARIDRMSELQRVGVDEVYRYRALDALFTLGPVLLVVLADERCRTPAELYAAAKHLKGDADPLRAAPGTIRGDLSPVNAVLNLLHVSDTPERSAVECVTLAGGADPGLFTDADLGPVLRLLESTGRPETRSCTDVVAGVRARLLGEVWPGLPPETRRLVGDLVSEGSLGHPGSGKVLAAGLDGLGEPLLAEVLRAAFDGSLPRPDIAAVRRQLAWLGLTLDPWELAVLTTSTYFPPAP